MLVEGVAGDFHRDGGACAFVHAGEGAADFDGGGRGHVGAGDFDAVVDHDGADEAGANLRAVEELPDEEGGCGFAVGAGDAYEVEGARGVVVEDFADECGGEEGVFAVEDGDVGVGEGGVVGQDCDCAGGESMVDEGGAVGLEAFAGDEEAAWDDGAAVFGDVADAGVGDVAWEGGDGLVI